MHDPTPSDGATPHATQSFRSVGRPGTWLSLSAASLAVFLFLTVMVEQRRFLPEDRSTELNVHHLFGVRDFPVFSAVSFIGGTTIHGLIILIVTIGLVTWRYRWSAGFLLIAQAGAIIGQLVKDLMMRARPHLFPGALHAGGYSFPSGHALDATLLYGSLAYLLWWHVGRKMAVGIIVVLFVGWALLIGLSRIVLGVHYPTDVEGGVALGLAWLYGTVAFFGPAVCGETRPRLH